MKKNSGEEIAAHLSAILGNPDTPAYLYNALADVLDDLAGRHRVSLIETPEVLKIAMRLIVAGERGSRRKRRNG